MIRSYCSSFYLYHGRSSDLRPSATSPENFYRLAPTLIQQAIAATAAGQIDLDALRSGLSYFSQPLLSWSLGGIVSWLCREIERNG